MSDIAPPTDQVRQRKTGHSAPGNNDSRPGAAAGSTDKDEESKSDDKDKDPKGNRFESVRQRIRSPLMGSLKLEDIRESITSNVEVK